MEKEKLKKLANDLKNKENYFIIGCDLIDEDTLGDRVVLIGGDMESIIQLDIELALEHQGIYQTLIKAVLITQQEREKQSFRRVDDINLN